VWTALTQPEELRQWFAESVEVEPREGGAYRFWGKRTYGGPVTATDRQTIVRFDPPRALQFRWDIEGADGEVIMTLAPKPDGDAGVQTVLTVKHVFNAEPLVPGAAEVVDDLWRYTLGNLQSHLRGSGVVMTDFSDSRPEVRLSIVIDAPRSKVFRALIDPAFLSKWLDAPAAEVDARVGGRYSYGWKYPVGGREVTGGPTRILELVSDEKLVTDWPDWRGDPAKPDTQVTWMLESIGTAKTKVTLIHSGFTRTVDMSDYAFGWREFAEKLKAEVERQ